MLIVPIVRTAWARPTLVSTELIGRLRMLNRQAARVVVRMLGLVYGLRAVGAVLSVILLSSAMWHFKALGDTSPNVPLGLLVLKDVFIVILAVYLLVWGGRAHRLVLANAEPEEPISTARLAEFAVRGLGLWFILQAGLKIAMLGAAWLSLGVLAEPNSQLLGERLSEGVPLALAGDVLYVLVGLYCLWRGRVFRYAILKGVDTDNDRVCQPSVGGSDGPQ